MSIREVQQRATFPRRVPHPCQSVQPHHPSRRIPMDSERFDSLTRALTSRRTTLGGLLGGGLAVLLGLGAPNEVTAHDPLPACEKLLSAKNRRACRRRARAHIRQRHTCRPQTTAATCAGRCGIYRNNCRKAVTCPCAAGWECLSNRSCERLCTPPAPPCPTGCGCSRDTIEGGNHCVPTGRDCVADTPQECTSTMQCPLGQHCQPTTCLDKPNPNRCVRLC